MKSTRHLLKAAGAIAAFLMVTAMTGCCGSGDNGKAKYIFLFIGDGMGASNVAVAESYLSYKAGRLGGEHLTFTGFPVFGMATTHSANHNITCSSAAGTAISCGTKTNNGYLCVAPDGNRLESISYKLQKEGYRIGIMSTVPVNHATPAAFYGHNTSRDAYYSIAQEIPQSSFQFFAGDGFIDYYGKDNNETSIAEYLEANGVSVCFSEEEFDADKISAKQIVLCQPSSKALDAEAYVLENGQTEDFSLGEMLTKCLDFLGDDEPFFIMCEGGRIDWDAHDNQTMQMVNDIIDMDRAVDVALEFSREHPDETLIVVTADHETGGAALGGPGGTSKRGDNIYWNVYEENEGNKDIDNTELNREANIGWTTRGHAGGPVPVYATGKGAWRFAGMMDNTEISLKIMDAE